MSKRLFITLAVLLVASIPIAVVLLFSSMVPVFWDSSFPAGAKYLLRQVVSGLDSTPLIAIATFVLSGIIMARGKISEKIFNVFAYFIGSKTAGMPCAVVVTCLFYGAISGSAPATVAAVGAMTVPILLDLGYEKKFCTALIAMSGGLGVIIPPSIPFIIFAMISGASVGDLFIAGIFPGILIAVCLMGYSYYYCKKHGEDKEKLKVYAGEIKGKGLGRLINEGIWALLSPVIVLGGIYSGIVTPTEASVISVIYSLIITIFVYKTLNISEMYSIFCESVKAYAPLLFVLGAATALARTLTLMQLPQAISVMIGNLFDNKILLLLAINILLLFVGMIIDGSSAILILTPILLPIVSTYGVNPVHFGVIMVVNLAIGFVTPPVGVNLYIASGLTGVTVLDISKRVIPFILATLVALMLITYIPKISLLLVG